jgi:hypothetical protein
MPASTTKAKPSGTRSRPAAAAKAKPAGTGRVRKVVIDDEDQVPQPVTSDIEVNFRKWIDNASNIVLVCRVEGHWWPDPFDMESYTLGATREGMTAVDQHCKRGCGTKRRRVYDPVTGMLDYAQSRYVTPDEYKMTEAEGGGWKFTRERRGTMRIIMNRRIRGGETMGFEDSATAAAIEAQEQAAEEQAAEAASQAAALTVQFQPAAGAAE